ncbi:gas vesicle accessory protein GvpU [Alkalihalophilus sp. As8PL]|uniref:Gas vesicle accessory protein GvpU n=1 Tax=Alkalihalophilus sp. As8PL TaxID=3237103 RepID=A0AB39BVM9_9BACI
MGKSEENPSTDDAVMQMLLDLSDQDGIEIGVTLNMNGTVVAGMLISPLTYYEGLIASADSVTNSTLAQVLHKKFSDLKEAFLSEKQEQEKSDKEMIATFIHLKDAFYLSSESHSFPKGQAWWRGRIDSIDGFSISL